MFSGYFLKVVVEGGVVDGVSLSRHVASLKSLAYAIPVDELKVMTKIMRILTLNSVQGIGDIRNRMSRHFTFIIIMDTGYPSH